MNEQHPVLSTETIERIVVESVERGPFAGRRVLVIIPDATRSGPIPQMFQLLCRELAPKAKALDFLIALGTHQPLSPEHIEQLVGTPMADWPKGVHVYNHEWQKPDTFVTLGSIPTEELEAISDGRLVGHPPVAVRINRKVLEYDVLLVCGPVFPHEVVGFSGGNKYFFPGISGPEVIDFSHWLGALITSYHIIGTRGITPVRRLINRAASFIPTEKRCLAMVVAPKSNDLVGLFAGTPEEAWAQAAELSAQVHVRWIERPYKRVLSIMPSMYDDIWTAAKGMYKLEPVIADSGEVVIYAPHITEFSYTHGALLEKIGYHTRDYFVKQWERFKDYPGGILAHSTHLRGIGSYDLVHGEQPRIGVTLATGISRERCLAMNLGYIDPASIHLEDWENREAEGILVVHKAGELLYRLIEPALAK